MILVLLSPAISYWINGLHILPIKIVPIQALPVLRLFLIFVKYYFDQLVKMKRADGDSVDKSLPLFQIPPLNIINVYFTLIPVHLYSTYV